MLAPARVEIEGSRVCHVASGIIGYDGDVIAYFVLNRPAFQRIEGIAHNYVGRPGTTTIGAVRVE